MGNDLQAPTTFSDGQQVNAAQFMAHVNDALIKYTTINSRVLKDPVALTDELLINDAGTLKKVTGQQIFDLATPVGTIIQRVVVRSNSTDSTAAAIPIDNTIPQIIEGAEYFTLAITPRFSNSIIRLSLLANTSHNHSGAASNTVAIFRGGSNNALGVSLLTTDTGNHTQIALLVEDSPATVLPITYSMRYGRNAAVASYTLFINRSVSLPSLFGGVYFTTMEALEIKQ
jgi:hypothetical protein